MKNLSKLLTESYNSLGGINIHDKKNLPSRESVSLLLEHVKDILFPGYLYHNFNENKDFFDTLSERLTQIKRLLEEQIYLSLIWKKNESNEEIDEVVVKIQSEKIANAFLNNLPTCRSLLKHDINATFSGDPAALSFSEVIMAYPGFHATLVYRLAHFLYQFNVPLIPRLMAEIIHSETGIDIHPGAKIGTHFCIDHGTGLVIGETTEIGNHVKIYQGVTLGALSIKNRDTKGKRHPTVENNVTIYARTTILGGRTKIGENSIIGGNLWIVRSIPQNSRVFIEAQSNYVIKEL